MSHMHGTYIGPIERLKGKTALLMDGINEGKILAQFDDFNTGLAYNWHEFPKNDFKLDEPVDWSKP